ncbi:hypothetical protein OIU77_029951 [Salix suchowensis]|uniref:Phytosulfokine-beta n=3 Tax=Salix TaxID=40685 RepID=A0A9Q0Q483_SALPP|nr:transmembrane protein [Salix suchowensis]KAJ6363182.1 hypothetical protein OIU78_003377 [Salix suchowensis]KAJ6381164.1 hypothetical protein OIU77_029951 [Salix suchowensis]KAJ6699758.1 hypothetical protein OIU79_012915 [Salix purpurea]KAJ6747253.1 hypothetical protein OIU74_029676 [Salix koriyanagi]
MKLLHLVLLVLLTITASYFFSQNNSSSSPSMFFLTGRRSMREQRMPSVTLTDEHENTKVLDEKTEQTTIKEDSRQLEYPGSSDNLDDLVYHVDYHGVTTHPTPKHPEP